VAKLLSCSPPERGQGWVCAQSVLKQTPFASITTFIYITLALT